jgi:Zn-dependent M16 (insulinase) family peptidase
MIKEGTMPNQSDCPVPTLKAGQHLHGFVVRRVEFLHALRVTAYEILHEKTGANVLHLHAHDRENLYAIIFRTPPRDSTGVPHILEHSVLAGSKRYPVKDAFNELIKGSLQTFINAFTYPDKTIYPVASQTRVDFYNLARVYTDLVLKPRLLRETFLQEGHHLEFMDPDDPNSRLIISGIVYNEMRGVYSSADSLIYKAIQENLYPDTPYAYDSGGAPDVIPKLTYEQFKAFHQLYYSPSNARIFLYGDIPTTDHLIFLEEMLEGFECVHIDSHITPQPAWSEPRSLRGYIPIGPEEPVKRKTTLTLSWMLADNTDEQTAILLEIVSGLLVGSAASPLRKALIESKLGEDLSSITGLERDLRQILFAVGLRGTEADLAPKVENLILDTLSRIVETGFDRDLVEGILHQVEFHGREIVRKSMPYGIALMGRVLHTWLYEGDPLSGLKFTEIIESIRKQWNAAPGLFQDVVRNWYLNNPHRLLTVMVPSRSYIAEREQMYAKDVALLESTLSAGQRDEVIRESDALKAYQGSSDSPEVAALLPRIKVGDLSPDIEKVPTEYKSLKGVNVLCHDLFTNGIAYLDIALDVSHVPDSLQPYLPLVGRLTTGMGAAGLGYDEMAMRIALKTGGLGYSLSSGLTGNGGGQWQKMIFRIKALYRNISEAMKILSDLFFNGDLTDEKRIFELIAEMKNGLHAAVIPSGHLFAKMSAGAGLSLPAHREEQWNGRSQLRFITALADRFEAGKAEFAETIKSLRNLTFRKEGALLNLTGDGEGLGLMLNEAAILCDPLLFHSTVGGDEAPERQVSWIGVDVPAEVSYVAQALIAPPYLDPLAAPLNILSHYLATEFLYRRIRVQGGAYGAMSAYNPSEGLYAFLSYRDPHIAETLEVFRDAAAMARREAPSLEDLEKAIIGTIGGLDRPMDPSGRGFAAMIRHFSEITDDDRRAYRQTVLGMTPEQLREAADRFFGEAFDESAVAVYAARQKLQQANDSLGEKLQLEELL